MDMDILKAIKERRSIRDFRKREVPEKIVVIVPVGYPSKIPDPPPRASKGEAMEGIE